MKWLKLIRLLPGKAWGWVAVMAAIALAVYRYELARSRREAAAVRLRQAKRRQDSAVHAGLVLAATVAAEEASAARIALGTEDERVAMAKARRQEIRARIGKMRRPDELDEHADHLGI